MPTLSRKETRKKPEKSKYFEEKTGKNQFQPEKLEFFNEVTPARERETALIGILPLLDLPGNYKRRRTKLESPVALV